MLGCLAYDPMMVSDANNKPVRGMDKALTNHISAAPAYFVLMGMAMFIANAKKRKIHQLLAASPQSVPSMAFSGVRPNV